MPWLGCPMRYESVPGTFWMLAPGVPGARRPGVLLALVRQKQRQRVGPSPQSHHLLQFYTSPLGAFSTAVLSYLIALLACSPTLTLVSHLRLCTYRPYVCKCTSQIPQKLTTLFETAS